MKYQRKLGFAIIGCGLIGNKRAGSLPQGVLKLACDLDSAKASALVAKYGGQVATKTSEVFQHAEVDVVLVSAANAALAPLTRLAVENGKHVLVEKPGAVNSKQFACQRFFAKRRSTAGGAGIDPQTGLRMRQSNLALRVCGEASRTRDHWESSASMTARRSR